MDFVNAIILLLNYIFIPALTYGSQLALGAIFVTLIYGILRFANFATGDMMSFGTMATILFTWYFQSLGVSLGVLPTALLAIPFGIIFMILYMLLIDKFVFKYYRHQKSPPVQFAMVSIGVMFVTQAVVRIIIGPADRRFFDGEKFIIKAREFKEMTGLNEGLALKSTQVITIFVTIVLVSLLFWFLNRTKTGKSMKAYSDNEDLALLSGIDPKKIVLVTWVIAGILATIGGALYGLDKSFKPFTYFNNMLPIFAAAIVGGIGNPFGAFLGGYVIAFSEIVIAIIKHEDWLTRGVKNVIGLKRPAPYEVDLQTTDWFINLVEKFNSGKLSVIENLADRQAALNQLVIEGSSVFVKLCYSGLFLVVVIILLILTQKALYSPWGRMMRAIRDNEEAANAMGKNVVKQHLLIFILGSAIVGIAGAMLVTQDGLFTPGSYRPMRYTFLIWVMVIVGGSGNNFGAILGGFVVWFLWIEAAPISLFLINFFTAGIPETNALKAHLIESVPYFRFLLMGLGLLFIMRYRPKGILPEKIEIK